MTNNKTVPKVIMPLADGGIIDVKYETADYPGCETCDYGSQYIDEFSIVMERFTIRVYLNTEYGHAVSEMWLMRTLLGMDRDLTEEQFAGALYDAVDTPIEQGYTYKARLAKESWFRLEKPDGTPVWEKNFPGIRS